MFTFGNFDLGQFVKTELTKQVQKNFIDNHIARNGVSALSSSVSKRALGAKSKVPEGVAMGDQLNGEFIPIIYGYMGMTNKQFDEGQKPSELDTEKTTQQVRIPVSEGPIIGMAVPTGGTLYDFETLPYSTGYQNDVLKSVVVDEKYVIHPTTSEANFKDLKYRMTLGDGTTSYLNNGKIENHNPEISDGSDPDLDITDAANDTVNTNRLNDLTDVQAGRGENYVLYWNHATSQWEAKAFNTLLNQAGLEYQGGAGGSGGSGGDGGTGGTGGSGGAGGAQNVVTGIKYTQWNPPPAHVQYTGTTTTEITYTNPPTVAATITNEGAPLFNDDAGQPFFTTTFDGVSNTSESIDLIVNFPNGIYQDWTQVTTTVNGTISICGTTRPIENSGNLDCLEPNVTVSPDGQTATEKLTGSGTIIVNYAFTKNLCGRPFVLHQGSTTISRAFRGKTVEAISVPISSMNAGYDSLEDGTPMIGSLDGTDDCNATDVEKFKFGVWDLNDYLTAYPNQIFNASDQITAYVWVTNKTTDEQYTISTNAYLKSISVCEGMNAFENGYGTGTQVSTPFVPLAPDHEHEWESIYTVNTNSAGFAVSNNRCELTPITSGTWNDDTNRFPDPLQVWDYNTQGTFGDVGSVGQTGSTGTTGSAGQSGTAQAPQSDPIPSVESSNSIYAGDGTSAVFTLSAVTVIHSDPVENVTLTISIPSSAGDLDVTTVAGGVSATGRGTHQLTLVGTQANLQTTVSSGLKFTSSTAAQGDIDIDFYISGVGGNSREIYKIRTQAQVEPVAPTFQIGVNGATGDFRCFVRDKAIMNTVSASGTIDDIAADIAQAINDYNSIPDWTAEAVNNIVTVTGPTALGDRYNGIFPDNQATGGNLMAATISQIGGGVSGSRITQPSTNTTRMANPQNFVKFGSYSNALNDPNVAWAEVVYRPEQDSGTSNLSEIGVVVAGRKNMQEPINDSFMTFDEWRGYNFNHPVSAVTEGGDGKTFSQNAAGHFYEYLTNVRYGLGNEIKLNELPYENWIQFHQDVYDAMAWCEDYGIKTNGIIFGQESKIEALQNIAATFSGRFVYINGYPRLMFEGQAYDHDYTHVDRTTGEQNQYTRFANIKKLVNQSSSAGIVYSGNSLDNVFNIVNVPWNDRGDLFKTKLAKMEVAQQSADYPFDFDRETTVEFWGVGDERLAQFLAKNIFETEIVNSETVSYVAGWDHYDVLPNDLIMLNDTMRMDNPLIGGRVVSDNGDGTVTLDRDCGSGVIYVTDSHGNICTGTASGTTATVSAQLGEVPNVETQQIDTVIGFFPEGAVWNMEANAENLYRVIAIEESEDGIYAVTAQKHDVDKYDRIRSYADQY